MALGESQLQLLARVPALIQEAEAVLKSPRLSPSDDSQQLSLPMQNCGYSLACTLKQHFCVLRLFETSIPVLSTKKRTEEFVGKISESYDRKEQ